MRCGSWFERADSECAYHPGEFSGITCKPPYTTGWSCCSADQRDATGCRKAAQHDPCEATARGLASFPVVDEPAGECGLRQRRGQKAETSVEEKAQSHSHEAPAGVGESYTVSVGDSLATVALRYGSPRTPNAPALHRRSTIRRSS